MSDSEITEFDYALLGVEVRLGRDGHLEHSSLARQGGPDATLACAYCGRARWMHRTRHDTCGSFCYVTGDDLTTSQLQQIRLMPEAPVAVRLDCSRALNEFGVAGPATVREARLAIAAAVNRAMNLAADAGAKS